MLMQKKDSEIILRVEILNHRPNSVIYEFDGKVAKKFFFYSRQKLNFISR